MNKNLGHDVFGSCITGAYVADGPKTVYGYLYGIMNSMNSWINVDGDSNWGHRNIFFEDGSGWTAAFGFSKINNDGSLNINFNIAALGDDEDSSDNLMNTIGNYAQEGPTVNNSNYAAKYDEEINNLKDTISQNNDWLSGHSTRLAEYQAQLDRDQDRVNHPENYYSMSKSYSTDDEWNRYLDLDAAVKYYKETHPTTDLNALKDEHEQKITDLNDQLSTHQTKLSQLKGEIESLQNDIANDKTALDNLNKGSEIPATPQKDNEKYTDLESDAIVKVTVDQNATEIPAPTLDPSAIIADTQANALFTTFAVQHGLYPAGTKVAWANPDQVKADAKIAGDHDEEVYLIFPDGTHSANFVAHNVLHVNTKSDDQGSTTDPTNQEHTIKVNFVVSNSQNPADSQIIGSHTYTGKTGDVIEIKPSDLPAGYNYSIDRWNRPMNTVTVTDQNSEITIPVLASSYVDDHIPDNTQYTNLDPNNMEPMPVNQGVGKEVVYPAIKPQVITDGTYPEGTYAEWSDLNKVADDTQVLGNHDEQVHLVFPDGTKSEDFLVPNILQVSADGTAPADPDQGGTTTPTNPDHGSTTDPSDHGNTPSTDPTTPDHGETTNPSDQGQTTTPDDHQGTQPSDQTPTTPVAPAHRDNQSQPASQLPAGYQVVNNQVVDVDGNVVSGWKVVNGQAVPVTREAYKAQQTQAQQLPQTGNDNTSALMGLGLASFASMLGLSVVNKKRN